MSSVYIKDENGGVVTAPAMTAGEPVAVLNRGSGGFQHWHLTDDGYLVLVSSSPELCLSVSSEPLQSGNQVFLQPKGANRYSQTWGYDREKSEIFLLEDNNYLLDNGSGGSAGPILLVDKDANAKWTLQTASQD